MMTNNSNKHNEYLKQLFANNEFEQILSYCNEQIKIDSTNYLFYGARGKAFDKLNEFEKAINDISKAIELYPNYTTGLLNRSDCYYKMEKYELAIRDIEKIHFLRSDLTYYALLGNCYYCLNNYKKAIEYYTLSLNQDLDCEVLFCRSEAYCSNNQLKKAILDIEKLHSLNKNITHYDTLGVYYLRNDNYQKAIENFTIYLNNRLDYDILEFRAMAYFSNNEFHYGLKDIETILLKDIMNIDYISNIEKINSIEFKDEKTNLQNIENKSFLIDSLGFNIFKEDKSTGKCIFKFPAFLMDSTDITSNSSGIYILEFTNNEYYIGETKKIQNRLQVHRKKFEDIQNIYFKPFSTANLIVEETKIISIFEKNLLRIRNLKQINFTNLFNENCQKMWRYNLNYNYLSGAKFNNEIVRNEFWERYKLLKDKIYFPIIVSFLSKYLKLTVPNYLASEYNYWNITCFPRYLEKDNCISRLNINAVPVLSLYLDSDNSLYVMLNMSKLPFLNYLKKYLRFNGLFENIPTLKIELRNAFEVSENDEITVFFNEVDFFNGLNNEIILSAIRLFNLRMMNNVGKEIKMRRKISHCLDLSDEIINNIG